MTEQNEFSNEASEVFELHDDALTIVQSINESIELHSITDSRCLGLAFSIILQDLTRGLRLEDKQQMLHEFYSLCTQACFDEGELS